MTAKHSDPASLMRKLSRVGFKRDFVRQALLPDWWEEDCEKDPRLLADVEIRVARFLAIPISVVRDREVPLPPPSYEGARLRRARDLDPVRLGPAIHAAMQVGAAAVRNLRPEVPPVKMPPKSGYKWRTRIDERWRPPVAIELEHILGDLWSRGIPVVPVEVLPKPNFQGLACIIGERPVILLGHKHDVPGRVAFFVAHEVGHVVSGHCSPDQPIVDEDEELADDDDMERIADRYAGDVLVGGDRVPTVDAGDYRELATRASEIGREHRIDPGAIIFEWARRSKDYTMASLAVKALYRAVGARSLLREYFERNVDFDSAPESDRALLRCVFGDRR
jgi:hypothetical protein